MTEDTVRAPAQVEAVREVANRLSVALELGPHERVLRGEPRATELDEPAPELGRIAAAADAIARLEHDDRAPALGEIAGGAQAGEPGADHDDVDRGVLLLASR